MAHDRDIPDPEPVLVPEDIVAVGGTLTPDTVAAAYRQGIFPWPVDEDSPLLWFFPAKRGVLFADDLHISRSLRRSLRRRGYSWRTDTAFDAVIRHCATVPRKDGGGTWIIPDVVDAYCALHRSGLAHSIEVFQGDDLVGGVYGVFVDNVFSGESMFSLAPDASKTALVHLVALLCDRGVPWIDTQMVTDVVQRMGGRYVSRETFLELMYAQKNKPPIAWPPPGDLRVNLP